MEASSPATKFITFVRLLWPLTERDALIAATGLPPLITARGYFRGLKSFYD
jgi:hypothetical protein